MIRRAIAGGRLLSGFACGLFLVLTTVGCTSGPGEAIALVRPTPQQAAAHKAEVDRIFRQWSSFDRNGDGGLDRGEWHARSWARSLVFDDDRSGDLNASEFVSSQCPYADPPDEFDRQCRSYLLGQFRLLNRNGRIVSDALRRQSNNYFRQNDLNSDGVVSESEYRGSDQNANR